MGSRSFCFDLSGDCKCASWLAARTREAGCCIFIPEDCWASESSKLDLEKDCECAVRVEHKALTILLLLNNEASPLHYFHVYIFLHPRIVSTQLYIIISHNTWQYPFKAMHRSNLNKANSIRNVMHIP